MIEFKQIIGRGTRLFDGKDYFTIYDFVRAHLHFFDPEWDGEPAEPEITQPRKQGVVADPAPAPQSVADREERRSKIKVKLSDGKERAIQHMMCTTFWHPDGTPMSAQQFIELLFGKLPNFFKSEAELREIWSAPDTRKKLLQALAESGFGHDQLAEMQQIIDAENSDVFDVLAHVAYGRAPVTRQDRAAKAWPAIEARFAGKQREFIQFVLDHYINVGVEELDVDQLAPLLRIRYKYSISDAVADLGKPEDIRAVFTGFQKHLYASVA